jgi:hypothetical protein
MKRIWGSGIGFLYWNERSGLTSKLANRSSHSSIDLLSKIQWASRPLKTNPA